MVYVHLTLENYVNRIKLYKLKRWFKRPPFFYFTFNKDIYISMKDLIRKILKETEEFDWAKDIINKPINSEAELLYLELKKFLEPKKAKNGGNYRVDVDRNEKFPEQDIYHIRDNMGTYESWFARDFNIKSLKSELERIMNQTRSKNVQKEYENLLKDLEPFFKKTMLREVEEFDWVPKDIFRTEDSIISYLEDNYPVQRLTVPNLYSDKLFITINEKIYFIENNKSLITNMLYNNLSEIFPGIEKGVLRRSIRKFLNQIV